MGHFATGVSVVTAWDGDQPLGMTVSSLTSVSLDPCLILVCLKKDSLTGDAIRRHGTFGVNILAQGQKEIAMRFARNVPNRFHGIDVTTGGYGPVIEGALGYIGSTLERIDDAGDHKIFLGRVETCFETDGEPLAYFRGGFGHYVSHATDLGEMLSRGKVNLPENADA